MPNNSGNSSVAWLMYHCGIAVDMDYDPAGSGAHTQDATLALANYFKYDQTSINFYNRADYDDPTWISMLKTELDNLRPIVYSGRSTASGGHAFVFDGYNSSDQFHVNWGWSGAYNGYFSIGDLTPSSYNFNDENGAVIGIQPAVEGEEKFYMVKKFTGFSNESEYPRYIHAVDETTAWAIGADGSGGGAEFKHFTRTTDGGYTWTAKTFSTNSTAFSMIFALNKDTAFISAWGNGSGNHVLRTYDGGNTWTPVLNGAGSESFFNVVHFFNPNDGVSQGDPQASEYELYTTTNGGNNWTRVSGANIPNPLAGEYGITGLYTAIGDNIWYTTNKGRVFYSTDKGYHWSVSAIYSGAYDTGIEIAFDDGGLNGLALVSLSSGTTNMGYKFYNTTDGGHTWTELVTTGNAYTSGISSIPGKENTFVSVGADYQTPHEGISITRDGGLTWTNGPMYYTKYQMVSVEFVNANKGFVGTFCGDYTDGMFIGSMFDLITANFEASDAGSNHDLFCTNTDITFTNTSTGDAETYEWDFGVDASPATGSGIGPFVVQYSSAGEKTIVLTVANSTTEDSDIFEKNITITNVSPANIDTIYGDTEVLTGETITYSVDNQSDVNFIWSLSSENWIGESTSNTIDVLFNEAATGSITAYAKNGCGQGEAYILDINCITGINFPDNRIIISPNPARDILKINEMNGALIYIYDISGKIVHSEIIESDHTELNIASLENGQYIIKSLFENKSYITVFTVIK
jgi:photosystem II stability/assembly factor-like uncharacterized protein